MLVTSDAHAPKSRDALVRFAQAMCENFPRLKAARQDRTCPSG